MNLLREVWAVLSPRQRRLVAGAQLLSIVMAFSTVAGIASIAPFFSVLGDQHLVDHSRFVHWLYVSFGFSSRRGLEVGLGAAFLTLVFTANAINAAGGWAMARLSWLISTDLKLMLLREYMARPFLFHARSNTASLLNNIIYETNMTSSMLQNIFLLITNCVTASLIILSVMLLNPLLGAAVCMLLGGGYVAVYLTMRNQLLRSGEVQSKFHAEQTKIVNEGLGAIKEIQVLHAQRFFEQRFEESSRSFAHAASHSQVVGRSPKHIMECVAVAGLVVAALLAGGRGDGVGPWLGQLTFLGFAAYRLLPTLQQAYAAVVGIRANRFGFAAIAPDVRAARRRIQVNNYADPSWQELPRREIRLAEVYFRYAPDLPFAAKGVSLRIPARSAVGLIGPNGSGKTTLVDMVTGLLTPDSGHVEIDGIVLDESNLQQWRSRIAYVPQSIYLLDASIAQNVAFGVPQRDIDRERLLAVAKLAQLDDFVASLPEGYEHQIGERGVKLSGGQRQRIGLARALYTDASVLIMDEATNALDSLTEQELIATLLRLRGRYTIILIAHRLSTLRGCDVIIELDRGMITASGTYVELLGTSESFRRLADIR
ncbi:MAG TPA: ABC transporter ATP-binding protein [Steroidobacteraceae bacterium]|nr:ABC transporter ATP-binding protein [Steroidobacteraceae bacterium]